MTHTAALDIELAADLRAGHADRTAGPAARGMLLSSLRHTACACAAHARDHEPTCRLRPLLDGPAPDRGRPYALSRVRWSDRGLTLRLHLYNDAIGASDVVREALADRRTWGIGIGRARATSVRITDAVTGADLSSSGTPVPHPIGMPTVQRTPTARPVRVRAASPLSIEGTAPGHDFTPPTVHTLLRLAARRLASLGTPTPATAPEAAREAVIEAEVAWADERRHSARTRRSMPMTGFTGTWLVETDYDRGTIAELARLLQWLPVGGRTAFGHGDIHIL